MPSSTQAPKRFLSPHRTVRRPFPLLALWLAGCFHGGGGGCEPVVIEDDWGTQPGDSGEVGAVPHERLVVDRESGLVATVFEEGTFSLRVVNVDGEIVARKSYPRGSYAQLLGVDAESAAVEITNAPSPSAASDDLASTFEAFDAAEPTAPRTFPTDTFGWEESALSGSGRWFIDRGNVPGTDPVELRWTLFDAESGERVAVPEGLADARTTWLEGDRLALTLLERGEEDAFAYRVLVYDMAELDADAFAEADGLWENPAVDHLLETAGGDDDATPLLVATPEPELVLLLGGDARFPGTVRLLELESGAEREKWLNVTNRIRASENGQYLTLIRGPEQGERPTLVRYDLEADTQEEFAGPDAEDFPGLSYGALQCRVTAKGERAFCDVDSADAYFAFDFEAETWSAVLLEDTRVTYSAQDAERDALWLADGGEVYRFDGKSGALDTIQLPVSAESVVFLPEHDLLVALTYEGNKRELVQLDLGTQAVLRRIALE